MITFSIDTTSTDISIFLENGNSLADFLAGKEGQRHVKSIISLTDKILSRNDLNIEDVDVFGVNLGPGDFTGTRIGITFTKTLSWLSKKGVYGYNALDVSAAMLSVDKDGIHGPGAVLAAPVMDVRNDELYYCFYRIGNGPLTVDRVSDYFLSKTERFLEDFIKHYFKVLSKKEKKLPVVIGGNGLKRYDVLVEEAFSCLQKNKVDVFMSDKRLFPDAKDISLLVKQSLERDEGFLKDINPIYVRDFQVFNRDGKQ